MLEWVEGAEYLADERLSGFVKIWGNGWDRCDFVAERPKEEVERCREAVVAINGSVVAPAFDAAWESYKPHQRLLENLDKCKNECPKVSRPRCVLPRCAYEGAGNNNMYVVATDATRQSLADTNNDAQVKALITLASRFGESFHGVVQDIVRKTNGSYKRGPQKKHHRIHDKAELDYEGDVSRVIDVERGTGIYDSADDLANAVFHLSQLSATDSRFTVVRVKDNLSKTSWPSHYRDVKFSIRLEGLVGELILCLRKIYRYNKKAHDVYSVERVVMNGKSVSSHCGLMSVPALQFTRDDGVPISDWDCLHNLQEKLKKVLPLGCSYSGGYFSDNAVHVYLGVKDVASFAKLRDTILLPDGKFSAVLHPFRVNVGAFIDLYATNLMKFVEFTSHQEEQLRKIRGADIALLTAPAGAGKTFVAIQCMLEALQVGAHILFVSKSLSLALFITQWLVLASEKDAQKTVEMVRVLIDDSDFKFADGPLRVGVDDKDGRQVLTVEKPAHCISSYGIMVVDEAHHINLEDAAFQEQLQKLKLQKYLFLGDASQMGVSKEFTKDSICKSLNLQDSRPIVEAKLTEVVRSTKRIVAGASSFQLTAASRAETKTHLSSEGLPLVSHIFAPVSADERTKAYACHVVEALKKLQKDLYDANLDDRVLIICPDDIFLEELREPLKEELWSQMKEKQYNLVSALDASAALPRKPFTNTTDFPRWLVFDVIDRVDGLERLAVIATGLDRSIKETEGDIQTRSAMYRALTRAQIAVAVVNEYVQDGFLEFLTKVKFDDSSAYNEKKSELQMSRTIADEVQANAVKKKSSVIETCTIAVENAGSIEISNEKKSSKKQKQRFLKNPLKRSKKSLDKISSVSNEKKSGVKNEVWPVEKAGSIEISKEKKFFRKSIIKVSSFVKLPLYFQQPVESIQTFQSIWDTQATMKRIISNEAIPRFMPFIPKVSMSERGFQLSTSTEKTLAEELTKKGVTDMNLPESSIGAKGVMALAEALKVNKSVTNIDLHHNRFGDEGIMALAEALKFNISLTSINLSENKIGDKGAMALAEALKFNISLTSINLSENKIGDKGAMALAEALKVNKSVTNIDLPRNRFGDEGIMALAEALKFNISLTSIDLSQNRLDDDDAMALAIALIVNKSVTNISLYHNKIGDGGAIALAEMLKRNTSLTRIKLCFNQIGDKGAKALAEALKVNTSLSSMELGLNRIRDNGAIALAEALKVNISLTHITVDFNNIGSNGITALIEVRKMYKSVKSITVDQDFF